MDAFLNAFFSDPLQYIGIVFAFIGAIGAILFTVGFFAGLPHFFTLSSNDDHQKHHRQRITWGTMILFWTFIAWEFVRIVASWFGYPTPPATAAFLSFILVLVIIVVVLAVMFAVKDAVVSGGH